jgi:Grx4 family monothiol glutaredoxin
MSVLDVTSEAQLKESTLAAGLTLLYFWADWCKPCVDVQKVVEELARTHGHARFLRVEAEKQPEISERLAVSVVPTFVALVAGKEVARIEGARIPDLVQCVAKLAPTGGAPAVTAEAKPAGSDLHARLVKLISFAPVMLFMKGTPKEPRCGFSRQAVEVLTRAGVKFSSFNILDHPEVRTGLKELSNWPTFPQLYVNGKLVGGLDVMKELEQEGELLPMFPKGDSLDVFSTFRLTSSLSSKLHWLLVYVSLGDADRVPLRQGGV